MLFSSSLTNDTNIIFVSCNGLNEAKNALINCKLFKSIGVINLNEIEQWKKVKRKSKCVNTTFTDPEQQMAASHFAFGFTTRNLHGILNFEFSLLDDKVELINLPKTEDKVPVLTFTIQVIK